MSDELYQQCILVKGSRVTTTWIPVKFAEKGKILSLKMEEGWEDGWHVMTQFGTKLTKNELDTKAEQYRNTRKTSDR